MKTCKKCHTEQPVTEYYPRDNSCKTCRKAMVRANYRDNREHYAAYDQRRYQEERRRLDKAASQARQRAANPEKHRAYSLLQEAPA